MAKKSSRQYRVGRISKEKWVPGDWDAELDTMDDVRHFVRDYAKEIGIIGDLHEIPTTFEDIFGSEEEAIRAGWSEDWTMIVGNLTDCTRFHFKDDAGDRHNVEVCFNNEKKKFVFF